MGVYILMDILPNEIDKEEWKKVYDESLELIKAYPFMSFTVDRETYDTTWGYVHKTTDGEISIGNNKQATGWHLFGDYSTLQGAESFKLFRDIENYQLENGTFHYSNDILAMMINNYLFYHDDQELAIPVRSTGVFDGKTQGFPHHIPLLAIACLIESRFPKQVLIWGDITIGQMEKAVEWANTILTHPIELTERANNKILLSRIKNLLTDELFILKAFFALTLHDHKAEVGTLLRKEFKESTITKYFKEHFSGFNVETIGSRDNLKRYIDLGFSIESTCDIAVLDPNGAHYDAEAFCKSLLSLNWPSKANKDRDQLTLEMNKADSAIPETVYSQFGKSFLQLAGVQDELKTNLSIDNVVEILESKLGHIVNISSFLNQREDEREFVEEIKDDKEFLTYYEELKADYEKHKIDLDAYSISDLDDIILWKKGDSIHPKIEELIEKVGTHLKVIQTKHKKSFDLFHSYSDDNKIKLLIKINNDFHIRKETWDYYIKNIHQPVVIDTFFALSSLKATEVNMNTLCKALVNNIELLNEYVINQE